jgi:hypothetical protein
MQKLRVPGHTLHVLHNKNGSWQKLDDGMHTDANDVVLLEITENEDDFGSSEIFAHSDRKAAAARQ